MFDLTNDLNNYLAPNERILWQGQGRHRLWTASNPGLLFALIFGGMAAFFLVLFLVLGSSSRSSDPVPVFFVVFFPLLFIAIGLGVGIPMTVLGRSAANARYIVTTAAAIIVTDNRFSGKRTTIIPLKNIAQLVLTENRDGTGTITFGSNPFAAYGRYYGNSWYSSSTPAFWNIEKPMEVYQLIRKQMTND